MHTEAIAGLSRDKQARVVLFLVAEFSSFSRYTRCYSRHSRSPVGDWQPGHGPMEFRFHATLGSAETNAAVGVAGFTRSEQPTPAQRGDPERALLPD